MGMGMCQGGMMIFELGPIRERAGLGCDGPDGVGS